ncbi:hypothetical protein [Promicromonospora soli]
MAILIRGALNDSRFVGRSKMNSLMRVRESMKVKVKVTRISEIKAGRSQTAILLLMSGWVVMGSEYPYQDPSSVELASSFGIEKSSLPPLTYECPMKCTRSIVWYLSMMSRKIWFNGIAGKWVNDLDGITVGWNGPREGRHRLLRAWSGPANDAGTPAAATCTFDPLDRTTSKTSGSETTRFIYLGPSSEVLASIVRVVASWA